MNDSPTNEDATAEAAELTELILDEVSRADQDWARIAALARDLAELCTRVADAAGSGEDPPPAT
jgi:hypothetical protein